MSDQTPEASRPLPSDLPAVSSAGSRQRPAGTAQEPGRASARSPMQLRVFICDFFDADTASISLLRGDVYRTLVNVGDEGYREIGHPSGDDYSVADYPDVTRLLRSGSGYVASIGSDGGVAESQRFLLGVSDDHLSRGPDRLRG